MNPHIKILSACWLVLGCTNALAAITCGITSSPGFTINPYTEGSAASGPTSVTVSCTRSAVADPISVNYSVALAGNIASTVVSGTTYNISYNLRDTACTAASAISGTITWPNLGTRSTITATPQYAGCVPAGQTGMAPGTYTGTIGLTLTYGSPPATTTASAPVSITLVPQCSIPQAPGTINFTYQAFSSTAATAETPFTAKCTNTHPYLVSVTPINGVVQGLSYSLEVLTALGVTVPPATSMTGTGADQNYKVVGTMVAGQAGTCVSPPCVPALPPAHTLQINY